MLEFIIRTSIKVLANNIQFIIKKLIVNDSSTDNTLSLIEELSKMIIE